MTERRPLTVGRPELLSGGTDLDFRRFLHAFMVFSRRLEAIRSYLALVFTALVLRERGCRWIDRE